MSDNRLPTPVPTLHETSSVDGDRLMDADRRALMGVAAGSLLASLLGGSLASPAHATSGLGFVDGAKAQDAGTPAGPKWWPSAYGATDEVGASNLITPERVLDAIKLVKTGRIIEMGRVYESSMPKFGERVFSLRIPGNPTGGPVGTNKVIWNDEFLATEIGQVGTQLDGLGHIGVASSDTDKAQMRFYNGFTAADIGGAYGLKKLGAENIKPVITRGHLIDMVAVRGRNMNLGEEITVADIEAALKAQSSSGDAIKPGDCVFFNTGWGALWNKDNAQYAKGEPGIGVPAAQWLIQKKVVVIGADSWAVEVVTNPDSNLAFPVHQELLAKNGIHIFENLDTSGLVEAKANQFLFLLLPLRIKGATGSPARPVAII
jgi:kynurenine formamidase